MLRRERLFYDGLLPSLPLCLLLLDFHEPLDPSSLLSGLMKLFGVCLTRLCQNNGAQKSPTSSLSSAPGATCVQTRNYTRTQRERNKESPGEWRMFLRTERANKRNLQSVCVFLLPCCTLIVFPSTFHPFVPSYFCCLSRFQTIKPKISTTTQKKHSYGELLFMFGQAFVQPSRNPTLSPYGTLHGAK